MKYSFLLLIFNIISLNFLFTQDVRVIHYNITSKIDISNKSYATESDIVVKNFGDKAVNNIEIILNIDSVLGRDQLYSILDANNQRLKFEVKNRGILIKKNLQPLDSAMIKFNYLIFSRGNIQLNIDPKNSWLLPEADFYPQVVNPSKNPQWFTYNIEITVPENYFVVCAGNLEKVIEENSKKIYIYDQKYACSNIPISIAKYEQKESIHDGIKIFTNLYPEHKDRADSLILIFGEILDYYTKNFGKYPFDDFKIIETERRGGHGAPGMIFLSSDLIDKIDNLSYEIIAHEIAHVWWEQVDMYTKSVFLSESMASYYAFQICDWKNISKEKNEVTLLNLGLFKIKLYYNSYEINRFNRHIIYEYTTMLEEPWRDYKYKAYYKGFFFLRDISNKIGRENLNKSLKIFRDKYKFQSVGLTELVKIIEEVSNKKLDTLVQDWIYSIKRTDYEIADIEVEKISDNKYKSKVKIENIGETTQPVEIEMTTKDGKTYQGLVSNYKDGEAIYEIVTPEEVTSAEVDPYYYTMDANISNNVYPRKRELVFLLSLPPMQELYYYYYPSLTFGVLDGCRIGAWITDIYPIPIFKRNLLPFEWRLGLTYGIKSKKTGYSFDVSSSEGMPSYYWNWGLNLQNFMGTENYEFKLDYKWTSNHQINLRGNLQKINNLAYYDPKDYEAGQSFILHLKYIGKFSNTDLKLDSRIGLKAFNSDYSFIRNSFDVETKFLFVPFIGSARMFGGFVTGTYPIQERIFLSGSVNPKGMIYWFLDPDKKISTQENVHTEGDVNVRGFIGKHFSAKNGIGLNLELVPIGFKFIRLFADLGNVWDNEFGSIKFDIGAGLKLDIINIDFPIYINKTFDGEKNLKFRWLIEVNLGDLFSKF